MKHRRSETDEIRWRGQESSSSPLVTQVSEFGVAIRSVSLKVVPPRAIRNDGRRIIRNGVRHTESPKHTIPHEVQVREASRVLDHGAQQNESVARIDELRPGLCYERIVPEAR